MTTHTSAPVAAPYIQGYWSRAEHRPRKPPDRHEGHKEKGWINEWIRGWDERDAFKKTGHETGQGDQHTEKQTGSN